MYTCSHNKIKILTKIYYCLQPWLAPLDPLSFLLWDNIVHYQYTSEFILFVPLQSKTKKTVNRNWVTATVWFHGILNAFSTSKINYWWFPHWPTEGQCWISNVQIEFPHDALCSASTYWKVLGGGDEARIRVDTHTQVRTLTRTLAHASTVGYDQGCVAHQPCPCLVREIMSYLFLQIPPLHREGGNRTPAVISSPAHLSKHPNPHKALSSKAQALPLSARR